MNKEELKDLSKRMQASIQEYNTHEFDFHKIKTKPLASGISISKHWGFCSDTLIHAKLKNGIWTIVPNSMYSLGMNKDVNYKFPTITATSEEQMIYEVNKMILDFLLVQRETISKS